MGNDRLGRRDLLLAASLFALTIALYGEVIGGWWLEDDPQVLIQVLHETPSTVLFDPARWRLYSASNFTPLVVLSYALDHALAGLTPALFYAHQLLGLALAVSLFFVLLRRISDRYVAFFAAFSFLVAPATMYAARTLMLRHYVEGLIFSIGALLLWMRRDSRLAAYGAAGLYFLATASKEVYAPLPLLMIASDLAESENLFRTARRLGPTASAAVVYVAWRFFMLGSGGGYGVDLRLADVLALPVSLWRWIGGEGPWAVGLIWAGITFLILGASVRNVRARPVLILLLVLIFALLPILPLASSLGLRLAFVPTAVMVAGVAMCEARALAWRRSAMIAFAAAAAVAGLLQRNATTHHHDRMSAEGRYIWTQPSGAAPLLARSHLWYIDGMRYLRRHVVHSDPPRVYHSLYGPVLERFDPARLVEVNASGEVVALDAQRRADTHRLAAGFQRSGSIRIWLRRRENLLEWKFAGAPDDRWLYLTLPGYEAHVWRQTGRYRFPREAHPPTALLEPASQQFRVVRWNQGRWTVTPPLPFPKSNLSVVWPRRTNLGR